MIAFSVGRIGSGFLICVVTVLCPILLSGCSDDPPPSRDSQNAASGPWAIEAGRLDEPSAAAINDAVAADGPDAIRLGAGDHDLKAPLILPSRSTLRGEGPGVTVLKLTGGRDADFFIGNSEVESGNSHITLSDLSIDCAGRAKVGVLFRRTANLRISNVEISNCGEAGLRVSGHGEHTHGLFLDNIHVHDNAGTGLIIQWASREVFYSNIRSHNNGGTGIIIDHSEGVGVNLLANGNGGTGIFFRNLFATSFTNVVATRNGRHGIYVQGLVGSIGNSWRAQSNSRSQAGRYDELYLSAADDLSYGVSQNSVIDGILVGGYRQLGVSQARYGIVQQADSIDIEITGLRFGETVSGSECRRNLDEACTGEAKP